MVVWNLTKNSVKCKDVSTKELRSSVFDLKFLVRGTSNNLKLNANTTAETLATKIGGKVL